MMMGDGDTLLEAYLPPEPDSDEVAGMSGVDDLVPRETAELRHLKWTLAARPGISERTLYCKPAG